MSGAQASTGPLNFSSTNEDGETELAMLNDARRILCLTGTGTRALDLLLSDADEVVALDANPAQNALLALKMAAIERFDRDSYLAFIGIAAADDRARSYELLREALPVSAADFWDRRRSTIRSGIWHAGTWERLLRWNGRFMRLFHGRTIDALMAARSIDEQAAIWERAFSRRRLRARLESFGRDLVWRLAMREPAGAFLPNATEVGKRIEDDFARASRTFLFKESDIATLSLLGRHETRSPLPVHMRVENYDVIRRRLHRLRPMLGELEELTVKTVEMFDGFSLSDFGSYCDSGSYARCWNRITAVADAGARFCERLFLHEMAVPSAAVVIDADRSRQLSASDKSIIYRIRAGTIRRAT